MASYIKQNFESGHFLEAKELNYSEKGLEQSFRIIEKLCPPLKLENNFISCYPVPNFPLNPKSYIKFQQGGSGEPSPDNIREISGWNEVNIARCGKNLLENIAVNGTVQSITYTINPDKTITINGTGKPGDNFIRVNSFLFKKGEKYRLSGCPVGGSTQSYAMYVSFANNVYKYDVGNGNTFEAPETARKTIFILVREGCIVENLTFKPMITHGEEVVEYEPYRGDTYTTQLTDTIYGGYYDWSAGALISTHEGKILSGTDEEGWDKGGSGASLYYFIRIGNLNTYQRGKIICSHYYQADIGSTGSSFPQNCIHLANSQRGYDTLMVRPNLTDYPDLESWKNFLKDNPITAVYERTIPEIIPISPCNILAQPGLNIIWSDAGNTEITGYANPLHIIEEQTATINNYETRIAALENAVANNN